MRRTSKVQMNVLRRAINGVLRMGRPDGRPESDQDALADIAVVSEEIERQEAGPPPLDASYDARLERALSNVPEHDYEIFQAWKSGMPRKEIAAKFSLHEILVLRSLVRTYSGLRMRTAIEGPVSLGGDRERNGSSSATPTQR